MVIIADHIADHIGFPAPNGNQHGTRASIQILLVPQGHPFGGSRPSVLLAPQRHGQDDGFLANNSSKDARPQLQSADARLSALSELNPQPASEKELRRLLEGGAR
jgi:hypothetical protein